MSDNFTNTNEEIILNYFQNESASIYFLLDSDYIVLKTNTFSEKLLGFNPCGISINDIIINFNIDPPLKNVFDTCFSNELFNINTFTGMPQSLKLSCFPLEDTILLLGSIDQIEVEKMGKELLTLNYRLNEMTRDLQKKNADLDALNKLKNKFLGMAAHDLRKPATIINMYSEFLLDEIGEQLSTDHKKFLDNIIKANKSMVYLINDFLDSSLIEMGQFKLNIEEYDLVKEIQNNVETYSQIAEKSKVNIVTNYHNQKIIINADKQKIEQVFGNLIINAIEYSPENSIITIKVTKDNNSATVSISDNGTGISPDLIDKLFNGIYSGTSIKKSLYKSSGLGLVISKKIIEAHKGTIKVVSEKGKGSVFSFSIPVL